MTVDLEVIQARLDSASVPFTVSDKHNAWMDAYAEDIAALLTELEARDREIERLRDFIEHVSCLEDGSAYGIANEARDFLGSEGETP